MGGSLRWMAPEIATGAGETARPNWWTSSGPSGPSLHTDGYFPDLYDLSLFHEKLECAVISPSFAASENVVRLLW